MQTRRYLLKICRQMFHSIKDHHRYFIKQYLIRASSIVILLKPALEIHYFIANRGYNVVFNRPPQITIPETERTTTSMLFSLSWSNLHTCLNTNL